MNRKSKWQEHINVYTNFLTPYNFSCYLLMLSKSHYLIALSYTLMQILSIAFCLAYQTGEIIVLDKPIVIKKHGYRQNSIFRVGLDTLVHILYNISTQLVPWIQLLSLIFQYPKRVK